PDSPGSGEVFWNPVACIVIAISSIDVARKAAESKEGESRKMTGVTKRQYDGLKQKTRLEVQHQTSMVQPMRYHMGRQSEHGQPLPNHQLRTTNERLTSTHQRSPIKFDALKPPRNKTHLFQGNTKLSTITVGSFFRMLCSFIQ